MNERDVTRLRDMLDAANVARSFVVDRTRDMLSNDKMFAFALVRAIEIVGEAANHVSTETQHSLPQIQWREIIGMRNKIIHDYIEVDYQLVWDVATDDLPRLIAELEKILPPEDSGLASQ